MRLRVTERLKNRAALWERLRLAFATCRPLLLAVLAWLACFAATCMPAQATVPGRDAVTLEWNTANRVYYGGYNTPIFTAIDGLGRASFAYCVDPTTTVPDARPYTTISVEDFNPPWASQIRAAMWFCYGGPGFDPAMWPSTWDDGSPMDAPKYYAASHLILTYATTRSTGHVYYNAGSDFTDYAAGSFLGVDLRNNTVNPNATMFQMFARAGEVPADYTCYYLDCGEWDYVQYVIAQDPYERNGSLVIEKTSLLPELSAGNPCYSLEGATFGVYGDAGCKQLVTTIAVGPDGRGSADGLRAGAYWVKELGAPAGYALNTTVFPVEVSAGSAAACAVSNEPQADRLPVLVHKVDSQTGGAPQGGGSLAGAEFTVRFYAGSYSSATLPSAPTRSWVFASNEAGEVLLTDEALVRGDPLYRDAQNTPVLPLGTVTVQETKAPVGYLLSDSAVYMRPITGSGRNAAVSTYQAPTVADAPARGGISIQKIDADTGKPQPQGAASMAGAEFSIVTTNSQPVVVNGKSYATNEVVLVLTTDEKGFGSTGGNALPCGSYRVYESKAPEGYLTSSEQWNVTIATGGTVVAVGTPGGRSRTVSEEAQTYPAASRHRIPWPDFSGSNPLAVLAQTLFKPTIARADEAPEPRAASPVVSEQVVRGGIRAYKVDADTGTGTPQGDASLKGTEFSIVSLNSGPVVVDGVTYERGSVVKRIYSDETGMAQTGARDLPYGYYTVEETGAPPGYLRSAQAVHVNRDGVIVEVGKEYENDVQRGGIRVQKIDSELGSSQPQGEATLAGTRFSIANASDNSVMVDDVLYSPGEVVMTITTGTDGIAQTGSRDLPFGTYTVTEIGAPNGYHPGDGASQTVEVRADNVLHDAAAPFANAVVRGGLSLYKCDANTSERAPQGSASLEGAVFSIANANDNPVVVDGKTYWPGEIVASIATDASGFATTGSRTLPIGSYTVAETAASPGYLASTAAYAVRVGEEGTVAPLATDVPEPIQRGGFGIRKFDAETQAATPQGGASLQGAQFHVVNANPGPVVVGGTRYEPGDVVMALETNRDGWAQTGTHDLPFGTYEVVEVAAPLGYRLGQTDADGQETGTGRSVVATVDGEWSWHSYESQLYDQVVRGGLGVTKVDAELGPQPQGNAVLEGAEFTISNASPAPVVVGGVSYQPGDVVARLVTDASGHACTGPRDLPFGTYAVAEVNPPRGYALDEGSQLVSVTEEGTVAYASRPYADQVLRGAAGVRKIDAEIGPNGPQGAASYQGAVFEIVNASPCPVVVGGQIYQEGEVVATLTTDAEGHATTGAHALPFGTYRIRETQPPKGYLVNETVWEITVCAHGDLVYAGEPAPAVPIAADEAPGEPGLLESFFAWLMPGTAQAAPADGADDEEMPLPQVPDPVARGGVAVQKVDAETGEATPQGGATLEGTRFAITSLNDRPVLVEDVLYHEGDTVMTVTTGPDGRAATPSRALPYGTYLVSEAMPPTGYLPAAIPLVRPFAIDQDDVVIDIEELFRNSPIRGGVAIQKIDAETDGTSPLGGATLAGARFSVVNASPYPVRVDEEDRPSGAEVAVLVTDIEGKASTDAFTLPFGTYQIIESQPPEGYTVEPHDPVFVTVGEHGQTVSAAAPFRNRVVRGDVTGIKVEDVTMERMPRVAFLVTSLTTGEAHVVVTDENGVFSTASPHVLHTRNTNANDDALDAQGRVVDESLLSWDNGVWFSGTTAASTSPQDALGALPFDRYRFDELLTSASHGHTLVHFELAVRQEGALVDAGTVDNSIIGLHTDAHFTSSGAHEGSARSSVSITDVVSYTNLDPHAAYELRGRLVNRETGEPILNRDGQPVEGHVGFTPTGPDGTVKLTFELDALALAGTRAVVLESLLCNGQEIAAHDDLADNAQTVTFVALRTHAHGQTSGTHEEQASPATRIVDTVTYEGLAPGQEYRFEGALVNRATGEAALDAQGLPVTATVSHTPTSPNGSVAIEFAFDGSAMAGQTVVAFEALHRNDLVIATHADLQDEQQAVALVGLSTSAIDKDTGTRQSEARPATTIIDTVRFTGLEPGATYLLEGVLVCQQTGIPLFHQADRAVTASVCFVPEEPDGEVPVTYAFDASGLSGQSVVAIETLSRNGAVVASHADLNDPNQTVHWAAQPTIPVLGYGKARVLERSLALAGAACAFLGVAAALLLRRETRAA